MNRSRTIGAGGLGLGILSLVAFPAAVMAGDASGGTSVQDSCPPLMAQSITQEFIQRRLDRGIATAPNGRIESRLNGQSWDANVNGASPFTATPGDTVNEFGTSLSQWGSWMAKNDAEKIAAAKALLAKGQKLPAPAQLDSNLDMWTQTRVTTEAAASPTRGQAYTSYVGADYKPLHGVVLGGLVQLDSAEENSTGLGGSAAGKGYMAGPYMALQLSPHIAVDAKAAWGLAQDTVSTTAAYGQYQTERQLTQARLKGDWNWDSWHLMPTATIESIDETALIGTGQAITEASISRMSVGPKLSRQFKVGNDKSFEPFVHMNSSLDLDTAGTLLSGQVIDPDAAQNTIGAGLALSQTDDYTLSATADVDNPGSEANKNLRTGVKLTIPLD